MSVEKNAELEAEAKKVICFQCQTTLDLVPGQFLPRREECPKCLAALYCCKMCRFYDPSSYNECKEIQANRVLDKEKANFCEYFKLAGPGGVGLGEGKDDLLKKAEALFKD